MDKTMRAEAAELRKMSSREAVNWLLQHCPSGPSAGRAIVLLEHVSLRRSDLKRLAQHYLAGPPHAHDNAYRLFARRLSLGIVVRILAQTKGRNSGDADLLAYHLRAMLRDAKDEDELREATVFVDSLSSVY